MNILRVSFCVVGLLAFAQSARAQAPFFFPGANSFTPQISVVESGAVMDVQATVSYDRKYVTLNMRSQNSTLLALRQFTFQNGRQGPALGNVGDPPPLEQPSSKKDDPKNVVRNSPSDILMYAKSQESVLHRPGMTRVSLLKD